MEVMGRHAGWLTAACALATDHEGDAPHVLLLPEIAFDERRFLAKVEQAMARYGHCVIAAPKGSSGQTVGSFRPVERTPSATHSWAELRQS